MLENTGSRSQVGGLSGCSSRLKLHSEPNAIGHSKPESISNAKPDGNASSHLRSNGHGISHPNTDSSSRSEAGSHRDAKHRPDFHQF